MEREKKTRGKNRKETEENRQGCESNLHSLRLIDWCVRVAVRPCGAGTTRTFRIVAAIVLRFPTSALGI